MICKKKNKNDRRLSKFNIFIIKEWWKVGVLISLIGVSIQVWEDWKWKIDVPTFTRLNGGWEGKTTLKLNAILPWQSWEERGVQASLERANEIEARIIGARF